MANKNIGSLVQLWVIIYLIFVFGGGYIIYGFLREIFWIFVIIIVLIGFLVIYVSSDSSGRF